MDSSGPYILEPFLEYILNFFKEALQIVNFNGPIQINLYDAIGAIFEAFFEKL